MILFKLMLVPLFVAMIAVVGRHWGAKIAGLLSGFPIIAGPIVYFLYLEQGAEFAKAAAEFTVAGVLPLSSFCFAYAWLATRFSWVLSVILALLVYLLLAVLMVTLSFSLYVSFALSLITIVAQIMSSPRHSETVGLTGATNVEVGIRMLCAACLVMLVTYFAAVLGAGYSGVFAAFPIASTVIAVFSHKNHSRFHAADSLKALKFGLVSLLSFFFVLAVLANHMTFNAAFAVSTLAAISVQLGIWVVKTYLYRSVIAKK